MKDRAVDCVELIKNCLTYLFEFLEAGLFEKDISSCVLQFFQVLLKPLAKIGEVLLIVPCCAWNDKIILPPVVIFSIPSWE